MDWLIKYLFHRYDILNTNKWAKEFQKRLEDHKMFGNPELYRDKHAEFINSVIDDIYCLWEENEDTRPDPDTHQEVQ